MSLSFAHMGLLMFSSWATVKFVNREQSDLKGLQPQFIFHWKKDC